MDVRRLHPTDGHLLDAALRAFGGFDRRADPAFLSDAASWAFVTLDGDTVVGFAWGHLLSDPDGTKTMTVQGFEIAEAVRKHGVGKELLAAIVEHARAAGLDRMWALSDAGHHAARLLFDDAPDPGEPIGPWWVFR